MIEFDHTCFAYDGADVNAIDDLSLIIPEGQFICILGGNGSGKSTLAKLADALLLPSGGAVIVSGKRTDDEEALFEIRSGMGLVFQNPDDQIVTSIVENDVAFGPENLGVPLPQLRQAVTEALAAVDMSGKEKRSTYSLSGGQKQRIAIAGALAMAPQTLIFDEATAMLDPAGRTMILDICRTLHAKGMTIILITHFMEEAVYAERVIALERGRIVLDGPPDEVLVHADKLAALNLDVPFACKLASRLQEAGIDVTPCVEEENLARQLTTLRREFSDERQDNEIQLRSGVETESHSTEDASSPDPSTMQEILRFENISFTYTGREGQGFHALKDVNFSVREGEFLGVAGHTGSGKSTLIQHMNGLLSPLKGRVLFRGMDLSDRKTADKYRGEIGLVFQYPEHQLFAETVAKDVAFGPRNLGLSEEEVDDRVRRALHKVGLPIETIGDKSPFELSGGQQRRVALAGILAMEPKILVLDEPSAGLDPRGHRELVNLISKLHKDGMTVVMASHVMGDLARLSDRVLMLSNGEVHAIGRPAEVFAPERAEDLRAIGLDIPSPQRFAQTMRECGFTLPRPMYSPGSLATDLAAQLSSVQPLASPRLSSTTTSHGEEVAHV